MNEKVSQKCAPVRGDVLTHQARCEIADFHHSSNIVANASSLTEPEVMRSSEFHDVEVDKIPLATYTFHYRSTRI